MGSNHMHELFRKSKNNSQENKDNINNLDYTHPTIEQCVKMLEEKYRYLSSGDAYAINRLIEFYKNNK